VSQHLAYIKLTSADILPAFLNFYLSTRYQDLRSLALGGGSTKGALTCGVLSGYPVPVPAIADQQAVIDALDSVARKLSTERSVELALEVVFTAALRSLMESTP
jgi:type I restriction enzyme S subunit